MGGFLRCLDGRRPFDAYFPETGKGIGAEREGHPADFDSAGGRQFGPQYPATVTAKIAGIKGRQFIRTGDAELFRGDQRITKRGLKSPRQVKDKALAKRALMRRRTDNLAEGCIRTLSRQRL